MPNAQERPHGRHLIPAPEARLGNVPQPHAAGKTPCRRTRLSSPRTISEPGQGPASSNSGPRACPSRLTPQPALPGGSGRPQQPRVSPARGAGRNAGGGKGVRATEAPPRPRPAVPGPRSPGQIAGSRSPDHRWPPREPRPRRGRPFTVCGTPPPTGCRPPTGRARTPRPRARPAARTPLGSAPGRRRRAPPWPWAATHFRRPRSAPEAPAPPPNESPEATATPRMRLASFRGWASTRPKMLAGASGARTSSLVSRVGWRPGRCRAWGRGWPGAEPEGRGGTCGRDLVGRGGVGRGRACGRGLWAARGEAGPGL